MAPKKRNTASTLEIDGNIRALRVYPVEGSKKTVDELQTVAIVLDREGAIQLATVLLAASQEWDKIDVTAFRMKPRASDGTFPVTVTSAKS